MFNSETLIKCKARDSARRFLDVVVACEELHQNHHQTTISLTQPCRKQNVFSNHSSNSQSSEINQQIQCWWRSDQMNRKFLLFARYVELYDNPSLSTCVVRLYWLIQANIKKTISRALSIGHRTTTLKWCESTSSNWAGEPIFAVDFALTKSSALNCFLFPQIMKLSWEFTFEYFVGDVISTFRSQEKWTNKEIFKF